MGKLLWAGVCVLSLLGASTPAPAAGEKHDAREFFELHLTSGDTSEPELIARMVLGNPPEEKLLVAEATVYWTLPNGTGMSVPLHPVTDKVLAAKVGGPFQAGDHRLLASVAVRNSEGFVEAFYEREYKVIMPSMVVTMKPMRSFLLGSAHASEKVLPPDGEPGGQAVPKARLNTIAWVGITLGMMGAAVAAVVLLARFGMMPTVQGALRSTRFAGTVLRPIRTASSPHQADPNEETSLPAAAAIEATHELIDSLEKPEPAEPEPIDLEKSNF